MTHQDHSRREERHALQRARAMDLSRAARVRLQCVLYAQAHGVAAAAVHFGFHRSTIAKWERQYIPGHPETLEEKSRAPHAVRQPETDPGIVEEIQKLRMQDPAINRTRIHDELCRHFDAARVPSESTIGRILKRLGLTSRDAGPSFGGMASSGSWMGGLASLLVGVAASLFAFAGGGVPHASAADIGPQTHLYNGRLLDGSGNAVTTSTSVRFSYWASEDYQTGDVDGAGAINTGAANYADWTEVHTVTPDSSGYFSLQMGSVTALPSLASYSVGDLADLFLQVEVKAAAAANTAYELLDINAADTAVDRSPILSVPFALNADRIDQRDVGTGSGSIPVLASGGLLPVAANPGSTNQDTVIIDNNNTAATEIALQFGRTLAEKLSYDIVNGRFNFTDDVRVEGDLTVTGLINGVDIDSLTNTNTYLKASSGAGLSLQVGGGDYRINGDVTQFAGSGNVTLQANATQNVYFTGTGLTVTTGDFPTDKSFIPVAQVVTNGTSITNLTDRRVLSSDNREQTMEKLFTPNYEHASYQGDASNNVGQLAMSHDNINKHNFYMWTSTKSSLQDYDLYVRVPLSSDFEHWDSTAALQIGYRSTSANSADNALAVTVYDTNGQPVTLGGITSGLASTSWTTGDITFSGGTWTPGQEFLIKFTFAAKDSYQMQLGRMRLKHVDLLSE